MVKEISNNSLSITKRGVSIIDFSSSWCIPCQELAPVFSELSKEIQRANFYKVDTDKEQELAQKFNVRTVPTIIISSNGQEIDRIIGFQGKEQLKQRILSKVR